MSQLHRFLLVGMVVSTLLGIIGREAESAEWSAEPSLNVKGVYNSNLLMSNGSNEVWGYWVSPAVKFKGATESFMMESNVLADFVHYYGQQNRGFTNLFFPLRTSQRLERLTFAFDGGLTRDNTLMGELRQTGLVLAFTQRNLWTAVPSVTAELTERMHWQVAYQYLNATYENGFQLGLVNYRVNGGSSELSYELTERMQIKLTGEFTNFVTSQTHLESDYGGVGIGVSHHLSDSVSATVWGGVRFVHATQGGLSQNDVVWLYNASVKKEFERSAISLEGAREINPSGIGQLIQTDRVSGILSHNLTENLSASLSSSLYFVNPIASLGGSFHETRFFNISSNLSWHFAPWWTLGVGYTYAERAIGSLDQWNFANSTFVMLTYTGNKWSVGR